MASQRRIEELERSLKYAEQAASCAPLWFRQFKAFEVAKCSRGDNMRVGSTDLHNAFVAYLAQNHRDVAAPPHKAFRELVEREYEYEQLFIDGTNKRGFRGISLTRL